MSIEIFFDSNNKYCGFQQADDKKIDYEKYFPDSLKDEIQNKTDKYGNGQYEISVTVKEVTDEMGTHTVTECKSIRVPMMPNAEQIEAYKKKRYVEEIRKSYSIDDEIALIKDAIKADKIPAEFTAMETLREEKKAAVQIEIQNDLERFDNDGAVREIL